MHHRGPISIHQFPCLQDNYGFLVKDEASGAVATIDTPDGQAIIGEAEKLGWSIDLILNTHWHPDHIGGNPAIVERFGAKVIAPADEGDKIPDVDQRVSDGDHVALGGTMLKVLGMPGHTLGHIAYHAEEAETVFVGDTLFSLGCGRLFEGTPEQMWTSLSRLRSLPSQTLFFCAHEYTAANAAFALSVDPDNLALIARAQEIEALRAKDQPTVPRTLAQELDINPFLRADDPALAALVGKGGAPAPDVFAEIRGRKDRF